MGAERRRSSRPPERLYTRGNEANWILDTSTGEPLGTLPSGPPPAVMDGALFAVNDGVLFASDASTKKALWQFGDGALAERAHCHRSASRSRLRRRRRLTRSTEQAAENYHKIHSHRPSRRATNNVATNHLPASARGNNLLVAPAGNLLVAY